MLASVVTDPLLVIVTPASAVVTVPLLVIGYPTPPLAVILSIIVAFCKVKNPVPATLVNGPVGVNGPV